MSFYNLGKGIFNSETHLVMAHAVNEETAKNLVDILNVAQKNRRQNKKRQAHENCACSEPMISTLVNPGFCVICKLPRR